MAVILKFLGALRRAAQKDEITLSFKAGASVLDLVDEATRHLPGLRKNILDEQLETPKPNALILVNGKEISVLKGLDTELKDGDEVVFVPVVHGG